MTFSAIINVIKRLAPYAIKYKWWGLGVMVTIFIRECFELMLPQVYKRIIDLFISFSEGSISTEVLHDGSTRMILIFIAFQVVIFILFILQFTFINRFEVRVLKQTAIDFIDRVLHLSFRFHSNRKSGQLSKEFSRGINGVEALFDVVFFNLFRLVIQFVAIIIIFATMDYRLSLIVAVLVGLFCTVVLVVAVRLQALREASNDEDDIGTGRVIDALMNAELVKYYQQEDAESAQFRKSRIVWGKRKLKEWDNWTVLGGTQTALMGTAITLVIWVLVQQILQGAVSPSSVVVVVSYCTSLSMVLWDFQWNTRRLVEGVTDTTRMFRYFDEQQEIVDSSNAEPLKIKTGAISFRDVHFAYNEQKEVLKGLSLEVPGGSSVALVGPSGVGKSTIIKMLYRFYDATQGAIVIDGQKITGVTQNSLRRSLSIVPQETALFNASIGYNISYGHEGATQEDIERVARLAHIHDFVMSLPQKYDTMVGERGIKLSGGEKQRISIARALLRDTPIVILDEPTSSLDSASEQEIQAALKNLMEQRTVVIIAHRLSTIMNSDQIAVVSDGQIAETGKHEELIKTGGLYSHLWNLQAGGYIPDVEADELADESTTDKSTALENKNA